MKKLYAVLAMIAAAILVPAALFAWGPSRTTYTIEHPADHVVFNSITNNPAIGDERNFMQVREANANNDTYADSIALTPGHQYVVFVYFHNNAASNLNGKNFTGKGVAKGAYVKAEIPAVVPDGSTGTEAVGYVGASNAKPGYVWDEVSFTNNSGNQINLEYVPGSATIHSKGKVNGKTMSDKIVSTGAALGYSSLNGIVPGCNDYAGYVTFRVSAEAPNFTVSKQVRKTGNKSWVKNEGVSKNDTVDYLISYKNVSKTKQNNVVVKDILPKGEDYLDSSTVLVNGTNPSGLKITSDNIVTSTGINIGGYEPGAAGYVRITAKVTASDDSLKCGDNVLTNTADVETDSGSKQDTATVTIHKTCKPNECKPGIPVGDVRCVNKPTPPELPHTGAGLDIASFFGVGAIVTSAGYYVASRRRA